MSEGNNVTSKWYKGFVQSKMARGLQRGVGQIDWEETVNCKVIWYHGFDLTVTGRIPSNVRNVLADYVDLQNPFETANNCLTYLNIPYFMCYIVVENLPDWLNEDITQFMTESDKLAKTKNDPEYKAMKNKVNGLIHKAKKEYFHSLLETDKKTNPWKVDLGSEVFVSAANLQYVSRADLKKTTYTVCEVVFSRDDLANSSLTGKQSNAFKGLVSKPKLDERKVSAVIGFIHVKEMMEVKMDHEEHNEMRKRHNDDIAKLRESKTLNLSDG